MPFQSESIEGISSLVDEAIAQQALSQDARRRISDRVDDIARAAAALQDSEGIERLSGDAVSILIVLVMD